MRRSKSLVGSEVHLFPQVERSRRITFGTWGPGVQNPPFPTEGDSARQGVALPWPTAPGRIVISADATPGQIRKLLAAGARAYLTKPLDMHRFFEVVNDALEEQRLDHAG